MTLRLFNTLSGQKEEFCPLADKNVLMYVCGITAYDHCHLGHARAYSAFDLILRYLRYSGYRVTYVRNVTDIDDKIINKAHEMFPGEHSSEDMKDLCREVSEKFTQSFSEDMSRLNLVTPDVEPRATRTMGDIVKIVLKLVETGYAYVIDGDVYFRISRFPDYGKLSKRSQEQMMAGARVEKNTRKESPFDFALWKKSREGEPAWSSPWGKGRPGWHIECSAMSRKHLDISIDIHGGGQDLIFPHHENEIAQSEAFSGKPFVRYWMHNGFITINREKMSKSLKNFKTVKELFEKYPPRAIKFYLLSTHYRSPLDFSDQLISSAFEGLKRIENALMKAGVILLHVKDKENVESLDQEILQKFREAMDDDFNSARAIGIVFDAISELLSLLNAEASYGRIRELKNTVLAILDIMGFIYEVKTARRIFLGDAETISVDEQERIMRKEFLEEGDVDQLLLRRLALKKDKDFAGADRIRDFLALRDVEIRDEKTETEWSYCS